MPVIADVLVFCPLHEGRRMGTATRAGLSLKPEVMSTVQEKYTQRR
jgi:hypothetical protein